MELFLPRLRQIECSVIIAPAMGGLVLGQEVARQMGKRFIFAEKEKDRLVLRRGFNIARGEKVLIVEDVVTRGGRVSECMDIVTAGGGEVAGVAVLVDRSGGRAAFPVPFLALIEMNFPTYEADALPPELQALPPVKPGS